MFHKRLRVCRFVSVAAARSAHPVGVSCTVAEWSQPRLWVEPKFHAQEMRPMPRKGPAARSGAFSSLIRYAPGGCCDLRVNEDTAFFCNGPGDVKSPRVIVTPPRSRFCPWSAPRPPHYAVRRNGEPI